MVKTTSNIFGIFCIWVLAGAILPKLLRAALWVCRAIERKTRPKIKTRSMTYEEFFASWTPEEIKKLDEEWEKDPYRKAYM